MKIRTGFVSNSSSSSFVVVFPRVPQDAEELHRVMFGPDVISIQPYDYATDSRAVAETVWRDIQKQLPRLPRSRADITQELHTTAVWTILRDIPWDKGPYEHGLAQEEKHCRQVKQDEAIQQEATRLTDEFLGEVGDGTVLIFEYCNNSSELEAVMEHGEIFHNLRYRVVHKH